MQYLIDVLQILQNKQMNRPIRKTVVSTPANVTGPSRTNAIVGTPKLSGHHPMPRNITSVQQGPAKCIISIIIFQLSKFYYLCRISRTNCH